jgi:glycosyltransferase involved in cell wall biosynthesis
MYKGFNILFAALALLKQSGLHFMLYTTVRGSDPQVAPRCAAMVQQHGLKDHVAFLGPVPQRQMGALYRMCDLVVCSSLCESFGFSLIEAMAHDVPIVAADIPISREICGDAALYYSPLDASAAAAAIFAALSESERTRLITNCRARLAAFDWSWDRYAKEFDGIIADAIHPN